MGPFSALKEDLLLCDLPYFSHEQYDEIKHATCSLLRLVADCELRLVKC